ncbi:MAG: conjugal transfer protein [Thermoleophilaceae bacterium]
MGELARSAGRVVLWVLLVLVLARGLGDIVSDAEDGPPAPVTAGSEFPGDPERAFAVRVARVYMTWQAGGGERAAREFDALLAPALRERFERGLPVRGPGQAVIEATVASSEVVSPDRAVVTVACAFAGERAVTRFVAVPVARDGAGGLIAYDLPALVAGPPAGAVDIEEPAPISGTEAGQIDRLARRFLAAYVSGVGSEDLAFFVSPGAAIGSLRPGLGLAEVSDIGQLGPEDPARPSIAATVQVRDAALGASYPARYVLELVRRERWYVQSIRGEAP